MECVGNFKTHSLIILEIYQAQISILNIDYVQFYNNTNLHLSILRKNLTVTSVKLEIKNKEEDIFSTDSNKMILIFSFVQ